MRVLLPPFLLALAACFTPAFSSAGDRSDIFQTCAAQLEAQLCTPPPARAPLAVLTHWSCADETRYQCMHAHTDAREAAREHTLQYFGKWPFWRVVGMQEPASVAFSLANFAAHFAGMRLLDARIPEGHPVKRYYLLSAYINMNAWVWSAVFHTRDVGITEKFDYFSAGATILFALYAAVIRLFFLYPLPRPPFAPSPNPHATRWLNIWTLICVVAYVSHVSYLSLLPRFDYSYNILANVLVGLTHNALWLAYALPSSLSLRRRYPGRERMYRPAEAGHAALFVLATMAAMGLEVFDFPPWRRLVDAHALWHLATVPIAVFWYRFLLRDALDDGWRGSRG